MTDQADQIADEAGRDGERFFDEIVSDLERVNTNPDMEPLFQATRRLYQRASMKEQDEATRILNLND